MSSSEASARSLIIISVTLPRMEESSLVDFVALFRRLSTVERKGTKGVVVGRWDNDGVEHTGVRRC